jgi:PAS domain S-box-containing protein
VPVALRLPSPSALEDANRELAREVAERKAAEATVRAINSSLEARVAERTAELESANARVAGTAEQLRLTIEAAPTSMIMADGAGTMVLVNAAVERLFGYRREQLLGRPLAMLLPERLRPWRSEIAADLLGLRHDGSEVPIEIAQNTLKTPDGEFVLSTIVDLSYRKRAEQLQQQMTALVESADDAILTLSLEGRVESWNPAAERLLCYPAAEIIGRPVSLLLPDDRKNEEDMFLERIREGSHVAHYETVRRRSDGSLVDVSLTISPIHTPTGAVVGASKIMRDISERRHFIEQLQDLNLALEQRVDARTAELKERVSSACRRAPWPMRLRARRCANARRAWRRWRRSTRCCINPRITPGCRFPNTRRIWRCVW